MSYEISILLNYFVVFIEAVGFIVFSSKKLIYVSLYSP